jgi:hypothetical protein
MNSGAGRVDRPAIATHQLVVAANSAGRNDDRLRREGESTDDTARTASAAPGIARREYIAVDAMHRSIGEDEFANPVTKPQLHATRFLVLAHPSDEWFEDAGSRAPGHVKARHAVARCARASCPTLRPPNCGEPTHTL